MCAAEAEGQAQRMQDQMAAMVKAGMLFVTGPECSTGITQRSISEQSDPASHEGPEQRLDVDNFGGMNTGRGIFHNNQHMHSGSIAQCQPLSRGLQYPQRISTPSGQNLNSAGSVAKSAPLVPSSLASTRIDIEFRSSHSRPASPASECGATTERQNGGHKAMQTSALTGQGSGKSNDADR